MRKNIIAGNWKMNKNMEETNTFIDQVAEKVPASDSVEAIVCAPYPYLPSLVEKAKGTNVKVSAQNMHFEENDAFTGELILALLKDIGVTHVVIGHYERREYFAETDETVNKKVHAAFKHNLTPIVCVGETLDKREAYETKTHVEKQVKKA